MSDVLALVGYLHGKCTSTVGMGGMGDLLACVAWVGLVMCLCS